LAVALARGDRVITPSNFAAAPLVARYNIPRERLTIIPRGIDIDAFDPAAVKRRTDRDLAPGVASSAGDADPARSRAHCALEWATHSA